MRTITGVLVLGLLVGCGGADTPPAQPPPPPPPAPTAPVADTTPAPTATAPAAPAAKPSLADMEAAAIKSMAADMADATKVTALYAPDAVMWMPGSPEAKGREAIQAAYQGWLDTMAGAPQGANVRTWTKGNQVVVHWITTATDKATGKPWGIDGLSLYTFNDDGLITKDHTYFDDLTVMKQTGAYKDERPARPPTALPTGATEAHVAKGDATEDANVAKVSALNDAFLKNDDKTALPLYADDYVSNSFTLWEPKDKKWVKEAIAINAKALKDRSRKDWTLLGVEDFTINESEGTSTQAGAVDHGKIHIPNKHKTVTTHGVTVAQWKDGKIAKAWLWSNVMELDKQLEIGPAAAKADAKGAKGDAKPAKADAKPAKADAKDATAKPAKK